MPPGLKPTVGKPAVTPVAPVPKKDESVAFFKAGVIPRLKIQIADSELQRLRQKDREYVRCTVTEDDKVPYEHVGIHLKGAAGSYRGIDDRPALTLNFDKFKDKQEFHGLDKIHLNNSVQDPSYLNELICSELFLAAKVPAARATHARVWLNGRDLGFYVLKEGFNKGFVKRHFANADGNLYEGGFVQDINGQPKLQNGSGVTDRSDVKALLDACGERDAAKRWQRLEQLVDIDQFLRFMAMELMTCHWDGYCNNRNNYRYYFEPKSGASGGKVHFFPHGMDQMFGDVNFSILNVPGGIVCGAVLSNPEWRGRYRDRVSELMPLFVPAERLLKRVDEHHQRMRPVLAEMGNGPAQNLDRTTKEIKDRLTARAVSLIKQNAVVEPRPLSFGPGGTAPLTRWEPRQESPSARLSVVEGMGPKSLNISLAAAGQAVGSWRTKVIVTAGKYRLEAKARTQGVKPTSDSSGTGVGVRVSGGGRINKLEGTAEWTLLAHEFEVTAATQELELVAEIRAQAGQVWFDTSSLRLVKVTK